MLVRWLTIWTWQPVNAKHYADFMTFFTSTSFDTTEAMDWTMKLHYWKLMVKSTTKSRLYGSIVSFVGKCNIW